MIVAIDGPAGSGKSTISKQVASRLRFSYLDTGAMYRAITVAAMKAGVDFSDENGLVKIAKISEIDFGPRKGNDQKVFLNGNDITKQIRDPHVTNQVKHIAKIPAVREYLVNLQRKISEGKNVVLEGRDTTTVVFPDAEFKVYLDADQKERAQRRFIELQEKGLSVTFNEILEDQIKRDESDFNREVGPLKKADDAHIVDTSGMSIDEVVNHVVRIVKGNGRSRNGLLFRLGCFICRVFSRVRLNLKVYGKENVPVYGGFILACNHISHLDPVVAGCDCPRPVIFLARETLFTKNKLFGLLIKNLNAVPIKRGNADRMALSTAEQILKEGNGVLFFPEGTRSLDGTFGEAKSGVGFVACRTKMPVIPVYIHGTAEAMPKGGKGIKKGKVSVTYGKAMKFSVPRGEKVNKKELYEKAANEIMSRIKFMQQEFLSKS